MEFLANDWVFRYGGDNMRCLGLAGALLVCSTFVSAALITSDPGTGTTTVFPNTSLVLHVPGPVSYGGFTITGNPNFSYGLSSSYNLLANGTWNISNVATDSATSVVTIDLGGLYGLVGGFMNYAPASSTDATITALAADGTTVLASYDLVTLAPISTPGATNGGAFRGIQLATNNIRYFQLSGDFILTHTIEVGAAASAVPEPGTFGLLGIALAAAGFLRRRKN